MVSILRRIVVQRPEQNASDNVNLNWNRGVLAHILIIQVIYLLAFLQLGEYVDEIGSVESLQFDFDTIKVATDNFSEENKLGQGGFGVVYKVANGYNLLEIKGSH